MKSFNDNKLPVLGLAATAGAGLVALVSVYQVPEATAGISATKHNLSTSSSSAFNKVTGVTGGTDQICVFCHTPHGSDTSAPAPLWNKNLATTQATAGFTTYAGLGSSTIDGEMLTVGSVSAACLSCHDGSQAMDNILNAPGSGGFTTGGGANGLNWSWSGSNVDVNGKMTGDAAVGSGGDLKNDHPIGIVYGSHAGDADFNPTVKKGTENIWWVDVDGNGSRNKTDMILYTRTFATAGIQPSVECASCHDPHTSANPTFLRQPAAGSTICLSCHIK